MNRHEALTALGEHGWMPPWRRMRSQSLMRLMLAIEKNQMAARSFGYSIGRLAGRVRHGTGGVTELELFAGHGPDSPRALLRWTGTHWQLEADELAADARPVLGGAFVLVCGVLAYPALVAVVAGEWRNAALLALAIIGVAIIGVMMVRRAQPPLAEVATPRGVGDSQPAEFPSERREAGDSPAQRTRLQVLLHIAKLLEIGVRGEDNKAAGGFTSLNVPALLALFDVWLGLQAGHPLGLALPAVAILCLWRAHALGLSAMHHRGQHPLGRYVGMLTGVLVNEAREPSGGGPVNFFSPFEREFHGHGWQLQIHPDSVERILVEQIDDVDHTVRSPKVADTARQMTWSARAMLFALLGLPVAVVLYLT